MSVLQAKARCLLGESTPCVLPSTTAVYHYALIWYYCLVRVLGDTNCYLPR
jgi:hypothetical protein